MPEGLGAAAPTWPGFCTGGEKQWLSLCVLSTGCSQNNAHPFGKHPLDAAGPRLPPPTSRKLGNMPEGDSEARKGRRQLQRAQKMTLRPPELDQPPTGGEGSPLCSRGRGSWTHTVQTTPAHRSAAASSHNCSVSTTTPGTRAAGRGPPLARLSRGPQPSSEARAQAVHHDSLKPRSTHPKIQRHPVRLPRHQPLTTTALPTVSTVSLSRMSSKWKKPWGAFQTSFSSKLRLCSHPGRLSNAAA